jgi:hypothetical protein
MSVSHRFPTPWSVEERADCFVVLDRNRQAVRYIYFKENDGRAPSTKLLTREQAEHWAANFAKLPELLKKL